MKLLLRLPWFLVAFLLPWFLVGFLAVAGSPRAAAGTRETGDADVLPNIVLVSADNLGYGDVECYEADTNIGDHTLGGRAAHAITHQINSDLKDGKIRQNAPPAQLYNLAEDPLHRKNVFREFPDVAARLSELLQQYKKQDRTVPRVGSQLAPVAGSSRTDAKSFPDSIGEAAKLHQTGAGDTSRDEGLTPPDQAISSVTFTYSDAPGIGLEAGVCRRDPSDVIRVGDTYYVYYTKVVRDELPKKSRSLYPSGYPGTVWYATSNDEGRTWTEIGEALAAGPDGAFDSFGVFTPNILKQGGRYFLYYTGVRPTPTRDDGVFENNSTNDFTAIGLAVSDSPSGPFARIGNQPIMEVSDRRDQFDSYRIDDACLLVHDGKVWLYYKGRALRYGTAGPRHTQMGVAVAAAPAGRYVRQNGGRPVQNSGHEVLIWEDGPTGGVMSLVSNTGPNGRTMQYAADGLGFHVLVRDLKDQPKAPGLFRPELTDPVASAATTDSRWGISMVHGRDPYLRRFEMRAKRPPR